MTEFYAEDLAAIHAEGFEALALAAAQTLLQLLPPPPACGRILDLGCGAGPLSATLDLHGYHPWGLDLSQDLIARARKRAPNVAFTCGSLADTDFPPASAAAAIGEVLNYATAHAPENLLYLFAKIFAALSPGGVLLFDLAGPGRAGAGRAFVEAEDWAVGVISTEVDAHLVRKITTFRKMQNGAWRRGDEEHHARLWPPVEVAAALHAVGFTVEQLPSYHAIAVPPQLHVYLARKP